MVCDIQHVLDGVSHWYEGFLNDNECNLGN